MLRSFCLSAVLALSAHAVSAGCSADSVTLQGGWGTAMFRVEVADDVDERARGLMFRESMARSHGMLFVYEEPQRAVFWMKNTLIPLDMVFLDRTGTVTRVHSNAIPGDLTGIDGGDGVYAVLEINGGLAKVYGIGPGDKMQSPVFEGGPAAWPCDP